MNERNTLSGSDWKMGACHRKSGTGPTTCFQRGCPPPPAVGIARHARFFDFLSAPGHEDLQAWLFGEGEGLFGAPSTRESPREWETVLTPVEAAGEMDLDVVDEWSLEPYRHDRGLNGADDADNADKDCAALAQEE